MTVHTKAELEILRGGGRRLAEILAEVVSAVRPGIPTLELDNLAEGLILKAGGSPVFKGYRSGQSRPFPASICTSINDEVVHAIPGADKILREGDIIGIDIGMLWPSVASAKEADGRLGLITDMAVTVAVGDISSEAKNLITATRSALDAGIGVLKPGLRLGDLGQAIQLVVEAAGFSVVRELVGHGVGRRLHEDPYVPNYGAPGQGLALKEGMVLALEPMAAMGGAEVRLDADGWTWRTKDGSLAAHFEHTVIVTKDGTEVLTKL